MAGMGRVRTTEQLSVPMHYKAWFVGKGQRRGLGITEHCVFMTLLAQVIREKSSFGREAVRNAW